MQLPTNQLLWHESKSSKIMHKAITSFKKSVAQGHSPGTLAICADKCSAPAQHPAHSRWELVMSWGVLKHKWACKTQHQSHFLLPHLCIAKFLPREINDSQVESLLQTWGQPGSFPFSCTHHVPGPKLINKISFSAIPCKLWWLLQEHLVWPVWHGHTYHIATVCRFYGFFRHWTWYHK